MCLYPHTQHFKLKWDYVISNVYVSYSQMMLNKIISCDQIRLQILEKNIEKGSLTFTWAYGPQFR